jgi:hypothetical protein
MVPPITAHTKVESTCCNNCTCNISCFPWKWCRSKTPDSPNTQARQIERVIEVYERRKSISKEDQPSNNW